MTKDLEMDLFDAESIESETKDMKDTKEPELTMPAYGSKEWSDYVMSKFEPHELIDGNPVCAGLRRVTEDVLGSIVSSRPSQVWPSTDVNGPGRATVIFEVVINWMDSGEFRTFAEVADVWHGNTDDLFCAHPVATASTRAEGRALRKALKVKCLAAEELAKKDIVSIVRQSVDQNVGVSGEWKEESNISLPQVNFIDGKCKQLDIHVLNFINAGSENYSSINDVSKKTASKMLATLNEYQTKTKNIPEKIKGYDSNWR
tara:strand:+ start:695 stop:1471 length:777 start_codon:yes stop_codon:yes gene_type:complete